MVGDYTRDLTSCIPLPVSINVLVPLRAHNRLPFRRDTLRRLGYRPSTAKSLGSFSCSSLQDSRSQVRLRLSAYSQLHPIGLSPARSGTPPPCSGAAAPRPPPSTRHGSFRRLLRCCCSRLSEGSLFCIGSRLKNADCEGAGARGDFPRRCCSAAVDGGLASYVLPSIVLKKVPQCAMLAFDYSLCMKPRCVGGRLQSHRLYPRRSLIDLGGGQVVPRGQRTSMSATSAPSPQCPSSFSR